MVTLVCRGCGTVKHCSPSYRGQKVEDWFQSVGSMCAKCRINPPFVDPKSLEARFLEFHAANPHVYDWLVDWARQVRADGANRIGLNVGFTFLRWAPGFRTDTWEPYRINQNFISRYARLIMETEPDLHNFFETRALRS